MAKLVVNTNQLGGFATNCYTVFNTTTREAVIVDPASNADFLCRNLKNQNLKLKAILLTHGHVDHIGAVAGIKSEYPDAVVYASKEEESVLHDIGANLTAMFGNPFTVDADAYLEDGATLDLMDVQIDCKLVPGHTKGGMCYYIAEEAILFSGDTLFASSIGRSDFPTGDEETLISTIKEKLMVLPEETVVYPGHNNRTTIGREGKLNPFLGEY